MDDILACAGSPRRTGAALRGLRRMLQWGSGADPETEDHRPGRAGSALAGFPAANFRDKPDPEEQATVPRARSFRWICSSGATSDDNRMNRGGSWTPQR